MSKHTPEPWTFERPNAIRSASGACIASLDLGTWEDARRIVACVNACARMNTETLELAASGAPDVKEWFQGWGEQYALEAQRDELAEALTTLLNAVEGNHVTQGDCNQARAALAKVQS